MAKASSRNYVQERKNESSKRKADRRARGRARYEMEKAGKVKKGDGKVVGHKKSLKANGSNSKSNLRIEAKRSSDKQGGRMGNKAGKAAGGRKSRRT